MSKKLPARPNLDHLRNQAKTLLGQLNDGDPSAAHAFIEHLPQARRIKAAAVRAAGFRLADAQCVVARKTGFAGWPALARHVRQLRALEGQWRFEGLEIEGQAVSAAMLGQTRLLLDGDRFRSESPEATYEGIFTIDVDASPARIDIAFVEGPDAGNTCYGIYQLHGDSLTLCLGLVGASRPAAFISKAGSGHALERLRRDSAERPTNVTGGTPPPPAPAIVQASEDPSTFDTAMTPMVRRLEGDWIAVELISDGKPMPEEWLSYGSRTMTGAEVTVKFGGQKMVHAKVRVDETATPIAIDYLQIDGPHAGAISRGIMEWIGDDVRILMPPAGHPRPDRFDPPPAKGTLSHWRRR